jgi:photosystem II stability/assembly factor-like uncharacterized protein
MLRLSRERRTVHNARWVTLLLLSILLSYSASLAIPDKLPVAIAKRPVIDIFFLPSHEGWIIATDGSREFLFRTQDQGQHWSMKPLNVPISRIYFLDEMRGFAVALTGTTYSLLGTSNGGDDWKMLCSLPELSQTGTVLSSVRFTNSGAGWLLGNGPKGLSVLLEVKTPECKIRTPSPEIPRQSTAIFGDPKSGDLWLVGNDSILYSSNSGKTWKSQVNRNILEEATMFNAGEALSDGTAFAVGGNTGGTIYRTIDRGVHWSQVTQSLESHWLTDIYFWDLGHGCAVGASAIMLCTADSGNTWNAKKSLPKSKKDMIFMENIFTRIVFDENGNRGFALATGGFLFQTDDSGNTWHQLDLFADHETD